LLYTQFISNFGSEKYCVSDFLISMKFV